MGLRLGWFEPYVDAHILNHWVNPNLVHTLNTNNNQIMNQLGWLIVIQQQPTIAEKNWWGGSNFNSEKDHLIRTQ